MTEDGQDLDELGPIEYLVVEFPGGKIDAEAFRQVTGLVDQHLITVLDLEFVAKRADGTVERIEAHDLGGDMSFFDGASSGLLVPEDLEQVGDAMAPGAVSAVLVYEFLAMLPAISSWKQGGARVIAEGPILAGELEDTLDATES